MLEKEIAKKFALNIANDRIEREHVTDLNECRKIFKETFLKVSEIFEDATENN